LPLQVARFDHVPVHDHHPANARADELVRDRTAERAASGDERARRTQPALGVARESGNEPLARMSITGISHRGSPNLGGTPAAWAPGNDQ
jgi:hypothetical protein